MTTVVYTDGACVGNPGPGGWAWAVPGGRWQSGAEAASTNQRMEIQAVLSAVTTLEGPLEVVSDSTYVVNCFRDRWWEGWLRRGWISSQKKPVANRDLWEPLIEAVRADPTRVRFTWVKGHSENEFNDLVDRLAVDAARTQVGRSGSTPPTEAELGEADAPVHRRVAKAAAGVAGAGGSADASASGGPVADADIPEGHRLVIAGHRPPELGGYDESFVTAGIRSSLAEILRAKQQLHPDLVVLTGLGLGAEQLGAEAAGEAGVPYVAVLPYPDPESVWPTSSQARFRSLLAGAKASLVLQRNKPTSKQQAGGALARRDAWLARNASEAVVVWDGVDDYVGRTVRSLQDHLGEEEVWVLSPSR